MHDEMPRRLEALLRAHVGDVRVVDYEPMTGGYSRFMAKVTLEWAPDGSMRRETLVLRGDPPPEQAMLFTDRDLEVDVIRHLTGGEVAVPAVRLYDGDGTHLGTKGMIIDFVDGPSVLAHAADGGELGSLPDRLCDTAAAIHSVPVDTLPASVARPADWDSYFDELIGRWKVAEQAHVEAEPFMRYLHSWLDVHRPAPAPLTLVHGDFQSANLLVGADGGLTVVDWEFAHVGDPREDLGWFRAVAGASPPDLIALDEAGFCERYRERTGLSEDVVNPATLSYFMMLSAINIYAPLIQQQAAWATNGTGNLLLSYNLSVPAFSHSVWTATTQLLEQALATADAAS